jgi:uncharacterized membrane protein
MNALIYQNGMIRELPPLPGSSSASSATAINGAGTMVGFDVVGPQFVAVRWQGTQVTDLNKLAVAPGVRLTIAVAINQSGQILANGTLNGAARAFLLTPQ